MSKNESTQPYQEAREILKMMGTLFDDGGLGITPPVFDAIGVVVYYTTRTLRNFGAVLTLCEQGYGVEAQALVRSMLEDVVDVRYISTAPETLAVEWSVHESRSRYYALKRLLSKETSTELPEDFAELEAVIAQDKVNARELAGAGANSRQVANLVLKGKWTRLSIGERARIAQKTYKNTLGVYALYGYLCDNTHGSAALSGDYVALRDGNLKAALEPNEYKSVMPLMLATYYASLILDALVPIGLVDKTDIVPALEKHLARFAELEDLERKFVTEDDIH